MTLRSLPVTRQLIGPAIIADQIGFSNALGTVFRVPVDAENLRRGVREYIAGASSAFVTVQPNAMPVFTGGSSADNAPAVSFQGR